MRLRKYHGLGNDFLILVDPDARQPVDGALARAVCDRHRGVGADGLIWAISGSPEADVTMELRNADGGRAETSGNGLRCLARAMIDVGLVTGPLVRIATEAGLRRAWVDTQAVTVEMGIAREWASGAPETDGRCMLLDVGNPHVVLEVADPAKLDLEEEVHAIHALYPGGVNIEFVSFSTARDEATMRVWERGVGETLACGSGACAAVWAGHRWGALDHRVRVRQPGGDVEVELAAGELRLTGPAEYVCEVYYPWP